MSDRNRVPRAWGASGPPGAVTGAESGLPATPPRQLRQAVDALRYRPFATFWAGALISNTGTWMQNVTVPYVIYRSTGSATLVGLTGFCQFIPALLLGPVGGWMADRYRRRSVLLVTQSLQAVVAVALWAAYSSGHRSAGFLIGVVFVTGVIQGLNIPAWQAFIVQLVPREALLNAVTLNSAQFNAARAIGPGIAGVVLGSFGASWAFFVNALSYGAVIAALLATAMPRGGGGELLVPSLVGQLRSSVRYIRATPGIRASYLLLAVAAGLGHPVFQLVPVFAQEVFAAETWKYGLMAASLGTGGVIGAVLLGWLGQGRSRSAIVRFCLLAYAVSLVAFGSAPVYVVAVGTLLVAGMLYISIVAPLNTTLQMQVPDSVRGGVVAGHVMIFNLVYPVGSLVQGAFAEAVGPRPTVIASATLIATAAVVARRTGIYQALDGDSIRDTVEPLPRDQGWYGSTSS